MVYFLFWLVAINPDFNSTNIDQQLAEFQKRQVACGPISLWYIAKQKNIDLNQELLIKEANLDKDGMSIDSLVKLCHKHGIDGRVVNTSLDKIPNNSILINKNHVFVYLGTKDDIVYTFDPASNSVKETSKFKFELKWNGDAIVFEPLEFNFITILYFCLIIFLITVIVYEKIFVKYFY